jgi:hypothetical protein
MPAGRPSKERHICQGRKPCRTFFAALLRRVNPEAFICTAKASVFENGRWYCKRHSPTAVAERERKSEQTYYNRIRRNLEMNKDER